MKASRFADPGYALYELATHFIVHCPKCAGRALIERAPDHTRLICLQCHHIEQPGHWYGSMTAIVSVKCRDCHAPLRRSTTWNSKWKKLAMQCDHCGDKCEYEAHLSKHWIHAGRVCDPVFGLPLWLQREFRGEIFWAYNAGHLSILRDYIGAKHRERGVLPRNTIQKNSAMLSRLPAFITKAGNREELLKLIGQLETK